MDLRDAECFLAIVEHRNFGRAADALGIAQPPLSRRIAALEREFGVALFSRERRQIELTPAGRAYAREAKALLTQAGLVRRSVRAAASGENGHVRMGFAGSLAYTIVPPAIRAFRASHPRVRLTLCELLGAHQIDALRLGTIDVALIRGSIEPGGLETVTVRRDEIGLILPQRHPLAGREHIALSDLRDEAFITFSRYGPTGVHDMARGICEQAGFVPHFAHEVDSMDALFAYVAGEAGIAFFSDAFLAFPVPGVVHHRLSPKGPEILLSAAWRPDTRNIHVRPLVETIRELAGENVLEAASA
jgi:DNA-binding transcriptional LysR family regulator